jgi:hypothetical protein
MVNAPGSLVSGFHLIMAGLECIRTDRIFDMHLQLTIGRIECQASLHRKLWPVSTLSQVRCRSRYVVNRYFVVLAISTYAVFSCRVEAH